MHRYSTAAATAMLFAAVQSLSNENIPGYEQTLRIVLHGPGRRARRRATGKGLHSPTSQLNLSRF
jgi:hypothetical protein